MTTTKLQAVIELGQYDAGTGKFQIPEEFHTIKDLWIKKDPECFRLMKKYIVALFIPLTLVETPDWLDIERADELEASSLEITGLVFNDADLPLVSAVAVFELPTRRVVTAAEWEQLEDETDERLFWAISFEWLLPPINDDEFPNQAMCDYADLRAAVID